MWRYVHASRAHVVVDAAAYFELMQQAMLRARQRIFMIGWDFDTRSDLARGASSTTCPTAKCSRPGLAPSWSGW